MGSKRTKKAKQELELIPNKNTITNGKDEEQIPPEDTNSTSAENEAPPAAITLQPSESEKATSPIAEAPSNLNESPLRSFLPDTTATSLNSLPAGTDTSASSSALPESKEKTILDTPSTSTTLTESPIQASNHVDALSPSAAGTATPKPKAATKRKRRNEGTEVVSKRFKKAANTPSKPKAQNSKANSPLPPKIETPMETTPLPTMNGDIANVENHKDPTPVKVASPPKVVTPAKVGVKVPNSGKSPSSAGEI